MLPSDRLRQPDRTRIRPRTVRVWKCRACSEVYDVDPKVRVCDGPRGLDVGCPKCGAGEGFIFQTRVKD